MKQQLKLEEKEKMDETIKKRNKKQKCFFSNRNLRKKEKKTTSMYLKMTTENFNFTKTKLKKQKKN